MSDVFLFGTYYSYNENLDPDRTADRAEAKWRSQFKVPADSLPYGDVNDWWYIGSNVHLIDISDLDYQMKIDNIPFNSNADWIKRVEGIIRVDENYIGINPVVVSNAVAYTPPTETNPNPAPFPAPVVFAKPFVAPQFIDFAEERLELGYDYGAVGGIEFKTQIVEVADDREQRTATRALPLGRWQLGDRLYAESEPDKLAEVSYLKDFHAARLGSKQGFRFKDWADYQASDSLIGVGDGQKTQWQLRKAYKAGNAITYRPIQKPVVGTVALYVDGINVALDPEHTWIVNHELGIISNEAPLLPGSTLSADFEFDVPVWFESDELPLTLEKFYPNAEEYYYKLGSVFVVEQRLPFAIPWQIEGAAEISEALDLGIIYQTIEKYRFSTLKLDLASGYSRKQAKREDSRILFDLGDRKYDSSEVDQILGYFWNARGKMAEFPFVNLEKNYKVRFNSDALMLKFEAASESDALFSLSGLKLQLKEETLYRIPPFSIPLEPIFIDPSDPNNPQITESGDSQYLGSQGGGGAGSSKAFNIASYRASGISLDTLPPGETAPNLSYFVAGLFWAAGTLNLLITSSSNASFYRYRLIHYALNLSNGWNFEYQASSSDALKDYIVSNTDISRAQIHKTDTGISQFFRAGNTVTFGDTGSYTTANNGLLRFEIADNGSFEVSFIDNSQVSVTTLNPPIAVYGDRAWVSSSGAYQDLGTFNGITYFKPQGGSTGFPIQGNIPEKEYQYNVWRNVIEPDDSHVIYHGDLEVFKYYRRQNSPPNFYLNNGGDGSYLIKALARYVCETGVSGCATADSLDLVYFFVKESYNSPLVLVDAQKWLISSSFGDSHYVQTYNSQKTACDRLGNQLVGAGNTLTYYQAGSGYGIDISSQLGFSVSNIRNKPAVTPYGFAAIFHSGNIFTQQVNLAFIQSQDG